MMGLRDLLMAITPQIFRGMIRQSKISTAVRYAHQDVAVKAIQFSRLTRQRLLADPAALEKLQQKTGLADLYWQALYYKSDDPDSTLAGAINEVDGYVFFLHGWSGSHRIWENLPIELTARSRRIVCFNLDVNGFGLSPFLKDPPDADRCSPKALMAAVEHWLAAINLWPSVRPGPKPFYLFVGHSMSGAALFYKEETGWRNEAYGLYALAPALLHNDVQRQHFYKTLGLGIRLPSFSMVKNALAPRVIDILGTGASAEVKSDHLRVFSKTPFGTIARTAYAMGSLATRPRRFDWDRFRVALGDADRLVGLNTMRELLTDFSLGPDQIRIMPGDHYFFSYGDNSPKAHRENRKIILNDLLDLCQGLTEEAKQAVAG
jgi:pimeloyl-ACP methyl ester carboxylesterase